MKCSIENCERKAGPSKGLCNMHYIRLRRHGDVNYVTPRAEWSAKVSITNRAASKAKSTTYKKLNGRHEHRIVAEQKIGRALMRGEEVHHIDGNRHNNHPNNLVVLSKTEHVKTHALERRGRPNKQARLTSEQVKEIRISNLSQEKLGKIYGVSQTTIWEIKKRRTYKYIS